MKISISTGLVAVVPFLTAVYGQVAEWGQCGGQGWTGQTKCASPLVCVAQNPYYSQCLPASASTTVGPTATTTGATVPPPAGSTSTASSPTSTGTNSSGGFVKTNGTRFTLNGSRFVPVGGNSYWVGLTGLTPANMNAAFADIAKTGATAVRTWGFNDVTTPNGVYYQSWSGSTPTINTGATGLQNFDNVVAAAKANGIRLIVALTNNWSDYGGMDVYVNQIVGQGQPHDLFYTNAKVMAAYKNYVTTFVTRYKNEPTIMAWELANEPRCRGSTSATSGTCTPQTVTTWASQMSSFIKSIDGNHLVAIGDEGFYNQPSAPTYPYQGSEGVDFEANLGIASIDFGTFHSYPESWGQSANITDWGTQWIIDHATSMTKHNKPVIMEEFGVTTNQSQVYQVWYNTIVSSGLTGDLIWQAGSHLSSGNTPDDGYAIYPDDPVFPVWTAHSAALKSRKT